MKLSPLLQQLQNKGFNISEVANTNIFIVAKKKKEVYFVQGYTPLVPYNIGLILSNKQITKKILEDAKLPTVGGTISPAGQAQRFLGILSDSGINYPVILRQENSQLDIPAEGPLDGQSQLLKSYNKLSAYHQQIMIEPYYSGEELRVFLSADGFLNILQRERGSGATAGIINLSTELSTKHGFQDVTSKYEKKLRKLAEKVLQLFSPLPYTSFRVILTANGPLISEVYHSATPHYSFIAVNKKTAKPVLEIMTNLVEQLFV